MKNALIAGHNEVHTADIYKDLAVAMRVKLKFHTEDDPAEIFNSPKDHF